MVELVRMKISLAMAAVIIALIILGALGIYWASQKEDFKTSDIFKLGNSSPSPTPQEVAKFTIDTTPAPQTQPESGSDTLGAVNLGIVITNPSAKAEVSSPIKVAGMANTLNGKVLIRIKDEYGNILGEGQASACLDVDPCPFEASIVFQKSQTERGLIEVSSGDLTTTVAINFQ